MNRQQRRAAQHKGAMRNPSRWQADPTAAFALIADRLPMTEQNVARCSTEVRLAWHHLCHGSGTTDHFDAVAAAMNICAVRAQAIGDDAVEVAERAQMALVGMQARYLRLHRFGPDADALAHVPYGLDQHVKHQLCAPHYVRYVDDMVLLHPSPQWLVAALRDIEAWLPANLGVHLNPSKTILQPVDRGIDFVGQVIKPWRRTTRRRTLASALQRIETLPASATHTTGNSYLGLVRQASHSHQERAQICRALLKRGHAVEGLHLSKAFRRSAGSTTQPNA